MYRYILFDADNTLLDFDAAEAAALEATLAEMPLRFTEDVLARYHAINDEEWKRLERGETTREKLRTDRFDRLYREFGINEDGLGLKTADIYVKHLSVQNQITEGALALLQSLYGKYRLFIITNGITRVQCSRLAACPLTPYIEKCYISQEMGVAKPDKRFFDLVVEDIGDRELSHYLVIGDSLTSDIKGAELAGMDCVYFDPHGKGSQGYRVTYTVNRLSEITEILSVIM